MAEHLNYAVAGPESSPALLLVHGFLSSNAQWLLNLERLAASFRVVTAELWGHGNSPVPDASAFTIDRYMTEFNHIRQELGISQWAVGGQSYAAGLAVRYAIAFPGHSMGVVTTNSRSAFGAPIPRPRGGTPRKAADGVNTYRNRHIPVHPVHAKRLPAGIRERLVEAADSVLPETLEQSSLLAPDLNAMDLLDLVSVPMMLANGRFERGFQDAAAQVRERAPHVEVIDMDGGHAVNIDAAEYFDKTVTAFLAKL